jgi:CheY-like chemotaxis protein
MTSGKILVVDDEPRIRRMLLSALTTLGYIVTGVQTGEKATGGKPRRTI